MSGKANKTFRAGMMVHTYNPNTWEVEAGNKMKM
jgi:hypothetical protein